MIPYKQGDVSCEFLKPAEFKGKLVWKALNAVETTTC